MRAASALALEWEVLGGRERKGSEGTGSREGRVPANPHRRLGQERMPGALGFVPSDLRSLSSIHSANTDQVRGQTTPGSRALVQDGSPACKGESLSWAELQVLLQGVSPLPWVVPTDQRPRPTADVSLSLQG